MDKTEESDKDVLKAVEETETENGVVRKAQAEDMETDQTEVESPSTAAKPDETGEKATEKQQADSVPEDGDSLCSVCGFSAKCPRSLKIHFARRHGSNSKNNNKYVKPAGKFENISAMSPSAAETKQNQQSDLDELPSVSGDGDMTTNSLNKKRTSSDKQLKDEEEPISTPQRRVSKRTPKPKIIHSCNSCGEEFLGKSLLDLHIQRYHTKDTSEYTLQSQVRLNREFSLVLHILVCMLYFKEKCFMQVLMISYDI